jgi:two-component system, cell cycle sensor histidine kinase and response regulator CckA
MAGVEPITARTVLIVDDEEMLVELVRRMVQRHGLDALTANSADEALRIFEARKSQIDLVITDLMMPGMDGKALAAELLKRDPEVRILVSTGYGATTDLTGLEGAGIKGVVMKPYQSEQLLGMVDMALAS